MRKTIRSAWTVFWVVFWSFFSAVFAVLFGLIERRGYLTHYCARFWARTILFFSGVRVNISGLEHLSEKGNYVFISNHESALDIPVLIRSLPYQLRIMTKRELFRIPLFGWALSLGGYIKVDRSDTEHAIASLQEAARRIPRQRVSVVVFPEGTRSPTGKLRRFKKGGFVFARQTGLPVVPVTILGSRHLTPKKASFIMPGDVDVLVDKPIEVTGFEAQDREHLVRLTREIIAKNKQAKEPVSQ